MDMPPDECPSTHGAGAERPRCIVILAVHAVESPALTTSAGGLISVKGKAIAPSLVDATMMAAMSIEVNVLAAHRHKDLILEVILVIVCSGVAVNSSNGFGSAGPLAPPC